MADRFALRGLAAGLLAGLLVAACGRGPELPSSQAPVGAEPQAAFQPINDVPIPAGARLDTARSLVLGGLDHWTGRLVIMVDESAAEAFSLYQRDMPAFGWQPITVVQAEVSVLSFARAARVATIQIESRTLTGAIVSITMSPREPLRTE